MSAHNKYLRSLDYYLQKDTQRYAKRSTHTLVHLNYVGVGISGSGTVLAGDTNTASSASSKADVPDPLCGSLNLAQPEALQKPNSSSFYTREVLDPISLPPRTYTLNPKPCMKPSLYLLPKLPSLRRPKRSAPTFGGVTRPPARGGPGTQEPDG